MKQEFIDAGRDENEAEILSTMAGIAAIRMSEQYPNVSIQQVMNITAKKVGGNDNLGVRESHNQALNNEVDLDTEFEVEPIELTGEIPTKEELTQKLRSLLSSGEIITKDNLGNISLGNNTKIKHVVHSSRRENSLNTEAQELRGRALSSIQELINNSVLVESAPNKKTDKKPNVVAYHRFFTPIATTDGNYYAVRIVAEESKNGTLRPIQAVLYDVIIEGKKKISPLPQTSSQNETSPDLHNEKLKITLRELLQNVKDADGNLYITPGNNQGEREIYNQTGFHGTRHIIEDNKFNVDKIGIGEGNQAFGWGIYLAENPKVAKFYRVAGMEKFDITVAHKDGNIYKFTFGDKSNGYSKNINYSNGIGFYNNWENTENLSREEFLVLDQIEKLVNNRNIRNAAKIKNILRENAQYEYERREKKNALTPKFLSKHQATLDFIEAVEIKAVPAKGNFYKIEGIPENDELLNWDEPFNGQTGKVQDELNSLIQYLETETDFEKKTGHNPNDFRNMEGQKIYKELSQYLEDGQKGASMLLNKFGIPGLRYLDAYSRPKSKHNTNKETDKETKKKTYNFVIWDTHMVEVAEISEDSDNEAKEYFQKIEAEKNKEAEVVEQRQPKGTREERIKFYEEFDKTHERPAYLDTGYVEAKITDHGSMIEIEFLGERANGISRRENLPSGRRADETERQRVIKYMLHDAIPELEMRVHDYFSGFPTIELSNKYNEYRNGPLFELSDEQKKEILDAAEKEIQRIMGAPLSQEGRELLEAQRYGSLPKGSEGLGVRSEEVKTTTEQETQETEEVENDTDGTLTDKKWGLPKGYRVEGAENPKSLKGAKKHQFVLRNGKRDWGYVTEDLAQGRADVPIGPIRVQAGNREYGLKHAITKHMNVILDNAVNIEAFIEDVIDNGNEIIPVGRDKQGRLSEFLVVWNDTKKNQNSVVIAWEEDGGYYTLKSAYPADSDYIKKQKSLSFGTTQTPNPASASIAYVNDKTLPGNNDATRYEDSDNNQSLTENVKNVNEEQSNEAANKTETKFMPNGEFSFSYSDKDGKHTDYFKVDKDDETFYIIYKRGINGLFSDMFALQSGDLFQFAWGKEFYRDIASDIITEDFKRSVEEAIKRLGENNQEQEQEQEAEKINEYKKRLNQYREWANVQPVELPKLKRNATQEKIKQAADEAITKLLEAFTITDTSGSKHILSEPLEKSLMTAQSPLLIEIAQKANELVHNEKLYEANKKDIPTYKKSKLIWFIKYYLSEFHTGHSVGVTLRELKRGILLFQKELGEISDGVYKSAISFIDKNGADKFNDNVLAEIIKEEEAANTQAEQEQEQQTEPKFDLTPEEIEKFSNETQEAEKPKLQITVEEMERLIGVDDEEEDFYEEYEDEENEEQEPKFNLTPEQIEELFEDENQDSEDLIYGEKGEQVPQFTPTQQPEAQEQETEQINASTSWEKGKPSNIAESLIEFFSTANKSSGFHEFAHHIMRVIGDVVEATEYGDNPDYLLINDFNMILENAGVSREEYENNEEKRNQAQEYFATSFETYLSEGHAPNKELVSAFERIKQWFVEVYRDIKEALGVELNDEMRDFFDRLLATPEQTAEQKSINDINSLYEATQEELEFTQDEIERLEAEQAEIQAQQELLEEMAGYEEPTIPQEVNDKVEKYLNDKEYEGLDDELFQAKLRSAKSKSAKLQAFKEKDRREAENLYAPYIAINTDTLNAFLQQAGIDATRNYLKERAEYIQKLIKNLQKRLPGSYAQVLREQKKAEKTGQKGETLKQAQSEYNAIKSDIDALINEQKEISDSAEFLNRIDPNEIKESISFDNAMMTLAEAINNGLKLAERYAGIVYNEAQETQKAESERRAQAEIQSIENMNEYQINKLNSEHEAEIKKLKEQQAAEIAELGEGSKEKIAELKSKYENKIAELKAAHAEKIKTLRENSRNKTAEKIASLKERYKQMKERQRERLKIRQEYNKLTGQIKRMAKSKNIIWNKQQKIKEVLGTYDNLIQKNYSLDDVREIHRQVEELYETGKRELEAKKLLIRERNAETRAKLTATLQEDYDKRPKKIIKGREDLGKDYSGIKGKARKILDWSTANMLGAQRFFDWLDGNKKYQGVWNKFMSDQVNEAHTQELRHKFRRLGEFEAKRKELGINLSSLRNTRVIDINGGEDFTISELMGIYAGLKNEKAKQAILNGNFANAKDLNEANEWAAKCVEALTDKEKELADFIIQEYENNFDRINDAIIDVYNQGMEHEENYTPMRRLVFETHRDGVFDPDAAENAAKQGAGFRSVEKGFTENRKKIRPEHQQGIDLDLISIWHSQVAVQEHAAAFAGLIRDMRSVLFARNKDGGATVYQMIKATRGQAAATKIRQYFNIAATSDALNAYDALEGISKVMARNMSIAYLCGNLGTMAKQTGSFPRVLVYAGPTATFNALGQFLRHPKKFLAECYKLDPQLEDRQRDSFIDELIKGGRGKIDVAYGNVLKAMSAPIGFSDRITSAIVFKAVYDANIKKGLSHDDAVREGQRVVLLTQPNTQAKDKPLVWQQHGYARLAMMFTTDMAQTFGETFYDLTASIRRGDVKDSFYRLVGLTLAACLIKCLTSGTPDEPDDPEELAKWIASAFTEQTINSIPVIGKNLVSLWDFKNGYFNSTDAFVAPFAKLESVVKMTNL